MEKLKMQSENLVNENIGKISELFPNCVTEGYDNNGKLIKMVDFDLLKQELSDIIVEGNDERYTMTWPGKKQSILTANSPINATLRPCKEESVDFDNTQNLYIEGDNLDVLKLLRETYLNKIKMIYIDPPYNTGNDFVYEDDFATSAEEYLQASKSYDDQGNKLFQNNDSNGRFHSDWLSMMYSRLRISRDLLDKDGLIFISIDDNEISNLNRICNEIFGRDNLVSILCVEMSKTQGMKVASAQNGQIVKNHEYVVIYSKNSEFAIQNRVPLYEKAEVWDSHFNKIIIRDGSTLKLFNLFEYLQDNCKLLMAEFKKLNLLKNDKLTLDNFVMGLTISDTIREFIYKDLSKIIYQEMACSISVPESIDKALDNNDVIEYEKYLLTKSSGGKIRQYRNLEENLHVSDEYCSDFCRTTIRGALWKGFYSDMMNIAKEGDIPYKNGKKPIRLMKQLAKWVNRKDGIVLDFFAGSCSTAHSIMQLNAEDGGNRKFIMVQISENIFDKNELYKMGFKNLCDVGKERIRRAGKKIKEENPLVTNDLDTGFRVLKLDSSCMKDIYYNPEDITQDLLAGIEDNIKEDRTPEDLLFQVMLDMGVLLSSKIEEKIINNKKVFIVGEYNNDSQPNLICCFDNDLTDDVVTEIAKIQPLYAVFRDCSIATDSVSVNFEQIFETYSPTTKRRVI